MTRFFFYKNIFIRIQGSDFGLSVVNNKKELRLEPHTGTWIRSKVIKIGRLKRQDFLSKSGSLSR